MIAVHGGISYNIDDNCSKWCADSLRGSNVTVVKAVQSLEAHPYFNCARGSNISMSGCVECEAGYMSMSSNNNCRFGAVGCVSNLSFPSEVAHAIACDSDNSGLVSPQVLVGNGAEAWAVRKGFPLCDPGSLITESAIKEYFSSKASLSMGCPSSSSSDVGTELKQLRLDTVGAVFISDGSAEACTSSGGILLKQSGRLGHCTVFGSGMWTEVRSDATISMSVSGCGEAIVRADFCRALSRRILSSDEDALPVEVVKKWFHDDFLSSPFVMGIDYKRRLAGGLLLLERDGCRELIVFHNAPCLPIAYRAMNSAKVKKFISRLDQGSSFICESYSL